LAQVALLAALAGCGSGGREPAAAGSGGARPPTPSVRITMAALHQAGGVPPGWRLRVPPGDLAAGRRGFADAGCPACRRRAGGAAEMLATTPAAQVGKDMPAAPPGDATRFYVQVYDVRPGELEHFERWFRDEGARAFLAHDGLVDVRTWVDLTRDGPSLVT